MSRALFVLALDLILAVVVTGLMAVAIRARQSRRGIGPASPISPQRARMTRLVTLSPLGVGALGAVVLLPAVVLIGWAALAGALAVLGLWCLYWSAPSTRTISVSQRVEIQRPRAEVWAFLADKSHLPLWYPAYQSAVLVSGQTGVYRVTIKTPAGDVVEGEERVEGGERGRSLVTSSKRVRIHWLFEDSGAGTALTVHQETIARYQICLRGMLWRFQALYQPGAERRLGEWMNLARAYLESATPAG